MQRKKNTVYYKNKKMFVEGLSNGQKRVIARTNMSYIKNMYLEWIM